MFDFKEEVLKCCKERVVVISCYSFESFFVKVYIKGNELCVWLALIEKVLNGYFDVNFYGRGVIVRVKNLVLVVGKMAN